MYGPARPRVFELLLEALGEPESVEVKIPVEDWRAVAEVAEVAERGVEERALVSFKCKLSADKALDLYRRYCEPGGGVRIWSFRAKWCAEGCKVLFNGFRLRMSASELADGSSAC